MGVCRAGKSIVARRRDDSDLGVAAKLSFDGDRRKSEIVVFCLFKLFFVLRGIQLVWL